MIRTTTDPVRILIDPKLCRDCQTCTLACSLYHTGECNLGLARLRVTKDMTQYEFALSLFESPGYPEERNVHFHGGPVGYPGSSPERCLEPEAVVMSNTAFAWYFTVAGAKSEELMLVDEHGASLKSVDPTWPMLEIDYANQRVSVPDILIRA